MLSGVAVVREPHVSVPSSVTAPGLIVQSSYSDNKSLYFCNPSLKYWILSALGIFRNAIAQQKKTKENPTQVNLSLSDSV